MTSNFTVGDVTGGGTENLPRLLIADDDPVVSSMLSAQLSRAFQVVAGARDAQEAIDQATVHQPDVAIIDVQMPMGGGLRATQEIVTTSPGTAIVAFSADESDQLVRSMLAAGATSYVRKGTPPHELAVILQQSIDAHTQLRAATGT